MPLNAGAPLPQVAGKICMRRRKFGNISISPMPRINPVYAINDQTHLCKIDAYYNSFFLLVSSADNICEQFGPNCLTLMVFQHFFSKKMVMIKKSTDCKNMKGCMLPLYVK